MRGLSARGPTATPELRKFLLSMHGIMPRPGSGATARPDSGATDRPDSGGSRPSGGALRSVPGVKIKVLDSVHEDGAKLVEMSPESVAALRAQQPGMRIVPLVYYYPAISPRPAVQSKSTLHTARISVQTKIKIVSANTGQPIAGAQVIAFTNYAQKEGVDGITNKTGDVSFQLGGAAKVERLYVYPEKAFWSLLKKNMSITSSMTIPLQPIDLSYPDAIRHFYPNRHANDGQGIKVAVIDSGINLSHPDLAVAGGLCTVLGENEQAYGDAGSGHGTHVAGLIAARGTPPSGLRGLAPAATLRSYRVFGENSDRATNFAIIKAIDRAVTDGCDLINMSLGGGKPDDATRAAIEDARAAGSLVIVASGNDGRGPVSFPALDSLAVAVSAVGRKGTFPANSTALGDVMKPEGKDKKNFVAAFSNIGIEIDLIGPGVDVISTVPGGYAPMSGTSMACPVVTGVAAKLLAQHASILGMARSQARSDAMAQMLLNSAKTLGFKAEFEGRGLP